jgi:tetratricopeptide (TPR) repeat protein
MTFLLAFLLSAVTPAAVTNRQMDELEARLAQDPASLRVAAEYRQLVIDTGTYDRSLKLFERLARDPRGGANRYVNLALATVDKVPIAGSFRRALLGRDAIEALSRAIAIEPTPLAYLVRGLVNLYYDQFIFHRTDKGVADLEIARQLAVAYPQVRYAPRILIPLGDGYWRLNQHDKAREVWREGQASSPDVEGFRLRLAARDDQIAEIIDHALDPGVRVDTTLREMFPDLTRTASKAVP